MRHGLARRAFGADIGRRNSENIVPRPPLRILRDAMERRRKAHMRIAAARCIPPARPAAAGFP